ncbi:MAG: hypothetical protein B7Y02_15510 [Rhodobacterales bacterium 17-64-5]|nr:MAG: hypothetical protein B7Y02_15510 [Rhodobacterales bacterium 17-64-5]
MPLHVSHGKRPLILIGLLGLQACAAVYFLFDGIGELLANPGKIHPLTEAPIALSLGIGIVFTAAEVRRTLHRMRRQADALAEARKAFGTVIAAQFATWGLTKAERDVAMLALRGMDVAEIAMARKAAAGTVRAQLSRIYAKAGVSGRPQFAAFFVEDLLQEGATPPSATLPVRALSDA